VSYDLHQKKNAYRRNGVLEYVVYRVDDGEVDWFVLGGGHYVRLQADADGLLKSRVFPGLWLDVAALLQEDRLSRIATRTLFSRSLRSFSRFTSSTWKRAPTSSKPIPSMVP
jgi:Uma2 family endonuclease